jgi:hypothetical protein
MKIEIVIEGIVPLLVNKFSDQAAMDATAGSSGSSAAADRGSPQEDAEARLHIGTKGQFIVPQPALLACIVNGGQFHKIGKRQLTTAKSSLLYAAVGIDEIEIDIIHKQPWKVDTRPVRIPATGGRILRHRPCFDDWKLRFTVDLDVSICNAKLFREVVDDAGKKIGLLDFRPACKGPYGRFNVIAWVENNGRIVETRAKAPRKELEPA